MSSARRWFILLAALAVLYGLLSVPVTYAADATPPAPTPAVTATPVPSGSAYPGGQNPTAVKLISLEGSSAPAFPLALVVTVATLAITFVVVLGLRLALLRS